MLPVGEYVHFSKKMLTKTETTDNYEEPEERIE